MWQEVKKNIVLIFKYIKFNLMAQFEYRVNFLLQSIGMLINNTAFLLFWWVVFQKSNRVGDCGYNDVLIIWALAAASYGLAVTVFGNVGRLSETIMNGNLDTYLLQPKHPLLNFLCSNTDVSGWGDMVYGYMLLFTVYGINMEKMALFSLLIIFGAILMTATFVIVEMLTFFIGNSYSIYRLTLFLFITVSTYPESIFGKHIRLLFYTLIPAGFVVYMPFNIIRAFNFKMLGIILFAVIFYLCITEFVFRAGLKRYESGNLIGSRL